MSRAGANSQRAGHAARTDGAGRASRSSVDRVHASLRDLAGVYPPGSRLKLTALATEHQVSFIPVRETLQRLEAERACPSASPPPRHRRHQSAELPGAMLTCKLGSAIAAGCASIVKPAQQTPLTAIEICRARSDAGAPDGLVGLIISSRPQMVADELSSDAPVRKVHGIRSGRS
jgi:hypothetical protein